MGNHFCKSVRQFAMALAAVALVGVSGTSLATPINLNVAGDLTSGGSYSGTFSYESDAADFAPSSIQGAFYLSGFDITVDTGNPSNSFHFLSPASSGHISRTTVSGTNVIGLSLDGNSGNIEARMSLFFLDLALTPSPYDVNTAPPSFQDFGAFQQSLIVLPYGFSSAYEFRNRFSPDPRDELNTSIASATVSDPATVPEPGAHALVLLGLGAMGIVARRRKQAKAA